MALLQYTRLTTPKFSPPPSRSPHSTRFYTTAPPEGHIVVTENAKKRLRELSQTKKENYLRVIVDPGGCSGFLTRFKLDDEKPQKDDAIFEDAGAKVVLDSVSLKLLNGATIDFTSEIARSAFVIESIPNATSTCGCKVSFGVD